MGLFEEIFSLLKIYYLKLAYPEWEKYVKLGRSFHV